MPPAKESFYNNNYFSFTSELMSRETKQLVTRRNIMKKYFTAFAAVALSLTVPHTESR